MHALDTAQQYMCYLHTPHLPQQNVSSTASLASGIGAYQDIGKDPSKASEEFLLRHISGRF